MTTRDAYSDAEWKLIITAPVAIISAVIGVSPGGPVGISQEVSAAVQTFEAAAQQQADNPLIAAVLVALKGRFESFMGKQPDDPASADIDFMALGRDPGQAVTICRDMTALLAQKAPAPEAEEFRRWLLTLATRVAQAANEGGVLGFGGERVNDKERQLLADLAAALDAPPPAV